MGNCSAACLHQKQSINEIDPRVGKESTSRLTNESLTSARVELKRSRRNKSASAAISKVWRRGKKTRVSPCDDGGGLTQVVSTLKEAQIIRLMQSSLQIALASLKVP